MNNTKTIRVNIKVLAETKDSYIVVNAKTSCKTYKVDKDIFIEKPTLNKFYRLNILENKITEFKNEKAN